MSRPTGLEKLVTGSSSSNPTRSLSRWSLVEDQALISSMNDLLDLGGWKADNGQFKSGSYAKLETLILQKLPNTEKKAKPHIESRVKILRKHFDAITDMLNASGFGWNDKEKHVTCSLEVWKEWIKSHPNAAGLRNKPFPYYDELSKLWGKDRATGNEAENVNDVLDEIEEVARVRDEEVTEVNNEDIDSTTQCDQTGPSLSTPQSTTPTSSKTKRARTETIEILNGFSTKLGKIGDVMEAATKHIGRLADCFQHESDSANRRMSVTSEIMNMEGLSSADVILASKKIALNPLEVDFFFSLPSDLKFVYVQALLLPEAP
ncbi:unnamed protein product [Amaranthus hypochondriacus]